MRFIPAILCVDDDEDDLLFVKEAIRAQGNGYDIMEATNGADAIKLLKNCQAKDELPCLVIMDINMPGMDGRQAIIKIRETPDLDQVPVAVFTTSSQASDKAFFESMNVHFLTKPFDVKQFEKRIVEALSYCAALNS